MAIVTLKKIAIYCVVLICSISQGFAFDLKSLGGDFTKDLDGALKQLEQGLQQLQKNQTQ